MNVLELEYFTVYNFCNILMASPFRLWYIVRLYFHLTRVILILLFGMSLEDFNRLTC